MFESTSDKILRVLIDNDSVLDISEKISHIQNALPKLSQSQIDSAITDLSDKNLIKTVYADGKLFFLKVQPYALSRLTDKRDFKIFNFKLDLIKIAFGYGLGFISAWLLK